MCRDNGRRARTGNPTGETRNRRTVWTIPTQPYSGSHFATFPEKLVEPCILAGSRPSDIVFDPFVGSGTVIRTATRLQRKGVGCDINLKYLIEEAGRRTSDVQLEFA
jgi:site-specific DNA-methyltransferase (cytosine-N4-specific)